MRKKPESRDVRRFTFALDLSDPRDRAIFDWLNSLADDGSMSETVRQALNDALNRLYPTQKQHNGAIVSTPSPQRVSIESTQSHQPESPFGAEFDTPIARALLRKK